MIDPTVLGADIAAVAALAVAAVSSVTTWLNWRGQRADSARHREHERSMRLLDSALQSAADFLAAAELTARERAGLDVARTSLTNANRPDADQAVYERYLANYDRALKASIEAISGAESAYAGLRLLVPEVTQPGRGYLDLCLRADAIDEARTDRERARELVEDVTAGICSHNRETPREP